jgi:hypothetical protein
MHVYVFICLCKISCSLRSFCGGLGPAFTRPRTSLRLSELRSPLGSSGSPSDMTLGCSCVRVWPSRVPSLSDPDFAAAFPAAPKNTESAETAKPPTHTHKTSFPPSPFILPSLLSSLKSSTAIALPCRWTHLSTIGPKVGELSLLVKLCITAAGICLRQDSLVCPGV